ncbi:hypothetical protein PIB30_076348 [Stylosanthes scabra]|uniref:Uncharacterized protein n=1 Tax=Stylosanthes scabra TaxID=79078 RepID=A0ABU6VNW9_9FABA|nr:hypothetical protein [Stylosanthes scabra]
MSCHLEGTNHHRVEKLILVRVSSTAVHAWRESAVNILRLKELGESSCHHDHTHASRHQIESVSRGPHPCWQWRTNSGSGLNAVPLHQAYRDRQLRSFAHFNPQPRHYGKLLATDGYHNCRKYNEQHKGRVSFQVALSASPNHSSDEALLGFRQVAFVTSEPCTLGQLTSSSVATIHVEPSSAVPPYLRAQVA